MAIGAVKRLTIKLRESLARAGGPEVEASIGYVGLAHGPTLDDDPDRTGSYAVGSATSDGQRFRILRPHARGGLGAVFVALDGELHREVALKQILEKHADDLISRQRFVAEAEITGGLEHPRAVPVYGLGTDGGFHGEPGRVSAGSDSPGEPGRVSAGSDSPGEPGRVSAGSDSPGEPGRVSAGSD